MYKKAISTYIRLFEISNTWSDITGRRCKNSLINTGKITVYMYNNVGKVKFDYKDHWIFRPVLY